MPIDYVPPPPAVPSEIRSVERSDFIRDFQDRTIAVDTLDSAEVSPAVERAVRRADINRDGQVNGPTESSRLFTELDGFDRDGSYHSMRLSNAGSPNALGRAYAHLRAHSRQPAGPPPVRSAIEVRSSRLSPTREIAPAPRTAEGARNRRLLEWYRIPSNYDRVLAAAGGTRNMCANFITWALEKSGALMIPRDTRYVGFDDRHASSVRMWAPSLARYLERERGFQRVYRSDDMKPGDILFTSGSNGSYNHVFMIESWVSTSAGLARVIDNQGFGHTRSLYGGGYSPTMYALRSFD
jgi:hypothetical protein